MKDYILELEKGLFVWWDEELIKSYTLDNKVVFSGTYSQCEKFLQKHETIFIGISETFQKALSQREHDGHHGCNLNIDAPMDIIRE